MRTRKFTRKRRVRASAPPDQKKRHGARVRSGGHIAPVTLPRCPPKLREVIEQQIGKLYPASNLLSILAIGLSNEPDAKVSWDDVIRMADGMIDSAIIGLELALLGRRKASDSAVAGAEAASE